MRASLRDALQGATFGRRAALELADARGDELEELLAVAAALRDRAKGRTVTFSPKVFVPLTNLCRDFCGYCTFRKAPGETGSKTMTLNEVLSVARRGRLFGCSELLFSLGDKPEAIYPEMKAFLAEAGVRRTLDYLYVACESVLEETELLPHSNPGLMGKRDLARLRQVNASMGLMLETASDRLVEPGGPHDRAPDKKPSLRLRMIEEAGKLRIAFTTGILIGIGETAEERIDSLFAIRELHLRYGHIQEVIVQNFRPKPDIPMRDHPEPAIEDMLRTIALARLILGGAMNLQAPPNLTPESYELYLKAGINDWGGVSPLTPDFINPEAPWPELEALREKTEAAGFELKARLPIYPEFIAQGDKFLSPRLLPLIDCWRGEDGLMKDAGPLGRVNKDSRYRGGASLR